MKKFTKICLTTALVLFLIGIILCLACGFLGGFRELNKMGGIGLFGGDAGGWRIGFFRSLGYWNGDSDGILNLEELEDIEDMDIEEVRKTIGSELEKKRKELEGKKNSSRLRQIPLAVWRLMWKPVTS